MTLLKILRLKYFKKMRYHLLLMNTYLMILVVM
nr:MAG TPA: hypothetical protein [Caudoviricetes sp.]